MIKSVVENYKEHGWKYFTPKRAWIFLRSKIRILTGYRLQEKHAIAFSEIITYKSLTCPDCAEAGQCRVCKCPINELFVAMDAPCSAGNYPEFQEKRKWNKVWFLFKKRKIKAAFNTLWYELTHKPRHWSETWKEYKEENNIQLMKFEE